MEVKFNTKSNKRVCRRIWKEVLYIVLISTYTYTNKLIHTDGGIWGS